MRTDALTIGKLYTLRVMFEGRVVATRDVRLKGFTRSGKAIVKGQVSPSRSDSGLAIVDPAHLEAVGEEGDDA